MEPVSYTHLDVYKRQIQKQHKISPAIAWLTIQKFIIFYCPLDGEHTKLRGGLFRIMNIKIAEFLMPVAHGFDQILKSSYFFFRNTG